MVTISYNVTSTISNIDINSYMADRTNNDNVFITTVSTITGTKFQNIFILSVTPTVQQKLRSLLSSSLDFKYQMTNQFSSTAEAQNWYVTSSSSITSSTSSGEFTSTLQSNSKQSNSPAFANAIASTPPIISEPTIVEPNTTTLSNKNSMSFETISGIAGGVVMLAFLGGFFYYRNYIFKSYNKFCPR